MKKIFALNLIVVLAFTVNSPSVLAIYQDLQPDARHYQAVDFLSEKAILQGYPDGTVRPNDNLNRAEFLTLVFRALELSSTPNPPPQQFPPRSFSDVEENSWYAPAVNEASQRGLINGYPDGSFKPQNPINKAEAHKILGKAFSWDLSDLSSQDPFLDVPSISWFGPYITYAKENNYLPVLATQYHPQSLMTRGEAADIIFRLVAKAEGVEISAGPTKAYSIYNQVKFTSQAPFGDWNDIRQSEGCEEASVLMAVKHFRQQNFNLNQSRDEILSMYNLQTTKYWTAHDTSANDTYNWLFKDYYNYHSVELVDDVDSSDIIEALQSGYLVVLPVNARQLSNPNYTDPGPLQHTILVHGYDTENDQFITHDPGTQSGANYRYSRQTIDNAIYDYVSGDLTYLPDRTKKMIIVKPESRS